MYNVNEFEKIIRDFNRTITSIPKNTTSIRLQPDNWTLKEIIGHLIDSASNNHQRFVRLQEGILQSFPGYNQLEWVRIQKYNDLDWSEIISLWNLMNLLLMHIIKNMDKTSLTNTWIANNSSVNLEFLVNDYFTHMKWHIEQFTGRLKEITDASQI